MNIDHELMRFRVTLSGVRPPVWRRIEVPASDSFWDLHVAVQDAMGWLDCHLHLFEVQNPKSGDLDEIGVPDPDAFMGDPDCLPGWQVPIADYFRAVGTTARYEYDFGDYWIHKIKLEAIEPLQANVRYPRCTGGKRACPPEDCGGPHRYDQLGRILADPKHEEHDSMVEWVGESFDPEAFSPAEVIFDDPRDRWQFAFGE